MIAATTRIAIRRETTEAVEQHEDDPWAPAPEVTHETITPQGGIAASIIERTRFDFDPTTGTPRTVRTLTGRIDDRLDVRAGDEVRDLRTGTLYTIEGAVTVSRTIAGARTLRFELSETDGE